MCVCVYIHTHTHTHKCIYIHIFSKQEYWSGLPFSTPGDLPNPYICVYIYNIYTYGLYIYILHIIKIKNFCASKDVIKKVKQQPTEWKKIFTNSVSYMCLIVSRIHKEHMYTYQCMYIHIYTQMYVLHLHMYTHTHTLSPA